MIGGRDINCRSISSSRTALPKVRDTRDDEGELVGMKRTIRDRFKMFGEVLSPIFCFLRPFTLPGEQEKVLKKCCRFRIPPLISLLPSKSPRISIPVQFPQARTS